MDLRYPIGPFSWTGPNTPDQRQNLIRELEMLPARLREAVAGLNEDQLDTPYRPGGWTLRQVVHHVADSHINSYVRFRLALTEEEPTIKPYNEGLWAQLDDARGLPVDVSLRLLEVLHARLVVLLRSMTAGDWERQFRHPESGVVSLDKNAAIYAWHGNHHIAHIKALRERMQW